MLPLSLPATKRSSALALFGSPSCIAGGTFRLLTGIAEGGGGKIKLLNAGAYTDQGVDVSLMGHPVNTPDAALVRTAAYSGMNVEYFGKEAHAAAAPCELDDPRRSA